MSRRCFSAMTLLTLQRCPQERPSGPNAIMDMGPPMRLFLLLQIYDEDKLNKWRGGPLLPIV